jgi:hypothetical protein
LYFVYQPPGVDGFCNKAARCIIGPIRHALLEKEASEKMQKENPVAAQLASHPSYTVLFFRKNKINLTSVFKFQSFQWASEFPSYLSKSKLPSKVISYSQAKGKNKQRNGNRKWGQRNLFDNDRA